MLSFKPGRRDPAIVLLHLGDVRRAGAPPRRATPGYCSYPAHRRTYSDAMTDRDAALQDLVRVFESFRAMNAMQSSPL